MLLGRKATNKLQTNRSERRRWGKLERHHLCRLPFTLQIVHLFSFLTTNPGHNVWRAAMLCCFQVLLRKCQVTKSDSTLLRGDFDFLITVRKSKTTQFQDRVLKNTIFRQPNSDLCAVYWCEMDFSEMPAKKDDHTFRIPSVDRSTPLTYKIYQDMLKLFGAKAMTQKCSPPTHYDEAVAFFFHYVELPQKSLRLVVAGRVTAYLTPLPICIVNYMRVAYTAGKSMKLCYNNYTLIEILMIVPRCV